MSIRIRIEHGQDAGKTVRLSRPGVYVLGRHTDSSLRVLDMKVSKAHCEVHVTEQDGKREAVFRDLGSTHGSLVNGQPISKAKAVVLKPGDELRLGLTILRVLSDGDADEELVPSGDREAETNGADRSEGSIDPTTVKKLPPDALVGKQLGGYKLEQKIGQGGMGAVYLAEQVSLHRKVALKVLSEKFVKDSTFVDQFLNEARAAGALNHPNVVQVYDVGEADGNYYFSMEFVAHGSIEEKLRDGSAYSWKDGLNWFLDATNALVFAQKREILHRDIKPDNLMLAEDGSAKLCDLGLAKRSENKDLMSQGIIGTPHFISPEAIRRKTDVDHRTDLYSLGCTFYRVLSGRNAYPGKTVKEILLGHLKTPVPHINDVNKDVPKELDEIVFKLMQKDPDDRFQSADELLTALDKVRTRHGLEAHGIAPKSRKPILILAAVAVLAAVGIGIWAANQERETVVEELPPEVVERNRQAAITLANEKYADAETDARESMAGLNETLTNLVMEHGKRDLYKATAYGDLAGSYETFSEEWRSRSGKWTAERDEQEHTEVKVRIDEAVATIAGLTTKSDEHAARIREEIRTRLAYEQADADALEAAIEMAKQAIEARKQACLGFLRDGPQDASKYIDLVEALKDLDALVKPALEKATVRGVELLTYDDDMRPLIEKEIKGDDWVAKAKKALGRSLIQVQTEAVKSLDLEDETSFAKAIATLDAYLETLPTVDPKDGDIQKQIFDNRRAALVKRGEYETERDDLVYGRLYKDKLRYFDLVRRMRGPMPNEDVWSLIGAFRAEDDKVGRFSSLNFDQALIDIARVRKQIQTDEYGPLVDMWRRDAVALQGLFTHLMEEFPWDGKKNIEWVEVDEKIKFRAQKANRDHLVDRKQNRLVYATKGPAFVLDFVFHHDGEARFTFSIDDMRGLAVLAEMAGDMDKATAYWEAYREKLDAEKQRAEAADVERRLTGMAKEREAAEHLTAIHELMLQVAARIAATSLEDDEGRQAAVTQARELNELIGRATGHLDALRAEGLAGTITVSAMRGAPHPGIVYAGREIPVAFIEKQRNANKGPGGKKPGGDNAGGNGPGGGGPGGGGPGNDDPDDRGR